MTKNLKEKILAFQFLLNYEVVHKNEIQKVTFFIELMNSPNCVFTFTKTKIQ